MYWSFSELLLHAYDCLQPCKVGVIRREDFDGSPTIRVVSDKFKGMDFEDRFQVLNFLFKKAHPELYSQDIYIFEAFTEEEFKQISK